MTTFEPVTNIYRWAWQVEGEPSSNGIQRITIGFDTNGDSEGKLDEFVQADIVSSNEGIQQTLIETINVSDDGGVFDEQDFGNVLQNVTNLEEPPIGYFSDRGWVEESSDIITDMEFHSLESDGRLKINGVPDNGEISLPNSNVTEVDFSGLSEGDLQKITKLDLSYNNLAQIPPEVSQMPNLTSLNIARNPNMEGDIGIVQDLSSLQVLDLSRTRVIGELDILPDSLTELFLNTAKTTENIAGDLSDLPRNLVRVNLSNQFWVGGDVSNLPLTANDISLYNTGIEGDIGDIPSDELVLLHIQDTRLTGDIEALSGMQSLRYLALNDTRVRGNVSSLGGLDDLRVVNLSYTPIAGSLDPSITADMSKLVSFFSNDSAIGFGPGDREIIEKDFDNRGVVYNLGAYG